MAGNGKSKMDIEASSADTIRAQDAPADHKYHPLILENTFHTQLLAVTDRIKLHDKHDFLQKLHHSFRDILSCSKCRSVLGENACGYSCGHTFCSDCGKGSTTCLCCHKDGCISGSKISNLSGVLDDVNKIKQNFNHESILIELIKFLYMPPTMIVKREPHVRDSAAAGTPLAPHSDSCSRKSRGKFTSTGKRFKTMSNKTDNTKRKLSFSQDAANSPSRTQGLENDSESLFINSLTATKQNKNEDKASSYLEMQSSIDESPKFITTNLKTYSRSAKRKLTCARFEDDVAGKLDSKDQDEGTPKRRKIKAKGVENHNNEEAGPSRRRSTRGRRMSDLSDCTTDAENASRVVGFDKTELSTGKPSVLPKRTSTRISSRMSVEPSEMKPEGTFLGFPQTHLTDSYNKLCLMTKYYNRMFKDDKVNLRISAEEDGNNVHSAVPDLGKAPAEDVKDSPDVSNQKMADENVKVIDYDKTNRRFSVRRNSKASIKDQEEELGEENKMKMGRSLPKRNSKAFVKDHDVKSTEQTKVEKNRDVKRRNSKTCDKEQEGRVTIEKTKDEECRDLKRDEVTQKEDEHNDVEKSLSSNKKRDKNKIKVKNTPVSNTSVEEIRDLEKPHSPSDTEDRSAKEVLNTSNLINPFLAKSEKIEVTKHNIISKKEKENFNINFSDDDTEDEVDINLWNKEDNTTRKRKSLFKAVKERNKKNVLLKLLEEKALLREREKNQEQSSDTSNNLTPDTLGSTTDRTATLIKESGQSNSPPESTKCEDQKSPIDATSKSDVVNDSSESTKPVEPEIISSNATSKVTKELETSHTSSASNCTYTPLLPEDNTGFSVYSSHPSEDHLNSPPIQPSPPSDQFSSVVVSLPRVDDKADIGEPEKGIVRYNVNMSLSCEKEIENNVSEARSQDNQHSTNHLSVSLKRLPNSSEGEHENYNSPVVKLPSQHKHQSESTITPVSRRSELVDFVDSHLVDSPQSAGMCSPVNPESAFVSGDVHDSVKLNTSTPILDKCSSTLFENERNLSMSDSLRKVIHSNSLNESDAEESGADSSIIIKTQRSAIPPVRKINGKTLNMEKSEPAEPEIEDDPETVARMNIKLKCANLKKIINDHNQKSLVSFQKNFKLISPTALSIAKGKFQKTHSPLTSDVSNHTVRVKDDLSTEESSIELRSSDENPLNKVQNLPSLSELDDVLTIPSSPARKAVACQTTPDLHIALLMQEFPHLFQHSNHPLSVYDTPVEPSLSNSKVNHSIPMKTPDIRESLVNQYGAFTRVSSVTSSEKKLFEKDFTERSVLCDSFRTPGNVVGIAGEQVNISCISLLPSSGEKIPETESQDSEKRKLSIRLNFQDVEPCSSNHNNSFLHNSSQNDEKDIISVHDSTYFSGPKVSQLNSCHDASDGEVAGEKPNVQSNASNEIEFANGIAQEHKADILTKSIPVDVNESKSLKSLSVSMVVDTERSFIPDTHVPVEEDVEMFCDDEISDKAVGEASSAECHKSNAVVIESNGQKTPDVPETDGCKSPEVNVDPDDDVDFVAGTPTCYTKRCIDSSFENLRSQSMITRPGDSEEMSSIDKSHLLFDSLDIRTLKTQTSNLNAVQEVSDPSDAQKCSNVLSEVSAASKVSTVKSVDLFNSGSVISTTVTVYITTSGLKEADNRIVKSFCDKFSAILLDRLTDKSTHLIVKTDAENQTSRTFKYLQAIVNCVRIVSINWLSECLRQGRLVDEESFIPRDSSGECGPLRAFNVARNVTPSPLSWLRDYCIFFVEPVPQGCTLSQLQEIIAKAGAVVVNSLKEMKKYPSHHRVIIVSEDDENIETSNEEIANWLQMYQAVTIEFNWLLEVIGRNRLVPFAEYEVVEIPNEFLMRLNFPGDMLEVEPDED